MFKVIWDKLQDIFGDKVVYIIIGGLLFAYGFYHINEYVMTKALFAQEKDKIEGKIDAVDTKACRNDAVIRFRVIQMEKAAVEQQQWALEDRIEKEGEPTRAQQQRLIKMERRLSQLEQEEEKIQEELTK